MGMMSVLDKLKEGLAKTRQSFVQKVQQLVTGKTLIDDDLLEHLEEILIQADIGVETTGLLLEALKRKVHEGGTASPQEILPLLKKELAALLSEDDQQGHSRPGWDVTSGPEVILVVGVNGVGKTTTVGKLAHHFRRSGRRVVVAAADTFRAAANEQLEVWANRADVDIIRQAHGADPGAVAFDAVQAAIARKADVVLIDTAGRLHTKSNLMDELTKIRRVVEKRLPGAPHEVLLVLDAGTGQNGLQQARAFSSAVGVTGLVVTKLDGTAKGGIIFAIGRTLGAPVKYVGVGEQIDDLQPFDRTVYLDALFDQVQVPSPG